MKQYTTSEQTTKLIDLGFAPTARIKEVRTVHTKIEIAHDCNFTIGELIEMLPEAICESKDDDYHYFLSIETDSLTWKVFYESEDEVVLCSTFGVELVDALCSMLTILKRRGSDI
jgi:hypothetical protein